MASAQVTGVTSRTYRLPIAPAVGPRGRRGPTVTSQYLIATTVDSSDGGSGQGFSWAVRAGAAGGPGHGRRGLPPGRRGRPGGAGGGLGPAVVAPARGGRGVTTLAMAAIDIGLWDLRARAAGLGLADLLGKAA